jgi:plasmid stability protein
MTPMSSYEPDPKTAKLFARHKQATETIRDTKKDVTSALEDAIRPGATSPQLSALTGMSTQTIRNIAERIGVDIRVKAPTVGREVEAKRAAVAQPAPEPNERPSPPLQPRSWPPVELGFDPRIQALTPDQAKRIAAQVELDDFGWLRAVRKRLGNLSPDLLPYAVANAALLAGKVELPTDS